VPWSARASRALDEGGRAGGRAEPVAESPGLSPHELQVALRVADGGSNAEVAAALFVTRRTVEFHLTNVYRKLGVRNRTELARWMSSRDSATSGPRRRGT
jgi:DNA-binding CsgD family transcriptional regulator